MNRQNFYLIGFALGWIASLCSITSLGILGMLDGCYANMSTFAPRKVMSVSSYLGSRLEPIRMVLEGSVGPRGTVLTSLWDLTMALGLEFFDSLSG